jgi:hypothetical protein
MDQGALFSVRNVALPSRLKPTDSVTGEGAVNATMVQVPAGYVASEIVVPFVTLNMAVLLSMFMNWNRMISCDLTGSNKMATATSNNDERGPVFMVVRFAVVFFLLVLHTNTKKIIIITQ